VPELLVKGRAYDISATTRAKEHLLCVLFARAVALEKPQLVNLAAQFALKRH